MKILFLIIAVLKISLVYSCEIDTVKSLNLYTNFERKGTFAFDVNRTLNMIPSFRAFNCKKLALKNRYMMIGMGPELNEFDDEVRTFSFNDDIRSSQCRIKNSPIKILPFQDKLKIFKQKKKYYNKCVQVYIDDEGTIPLRITQNQPGCKVRKITSHKAVIEGGYCFIKPNITSSFLFKLRIRPECQTREGLKSLGLDPSDIKGIFNFYSAGDETGLSTSLQALDSVPLRLITSSDPNVIESSESYGGLHPEFPVNYVNPNTFLGDVKMEDIGGDRYRLRTPVLVDNRCDKKCSNGICYSPCNYAQPVVYEALLYEVEKNKDSILTSWYDGGVAGPGYQGFINGVGFEIPTRYFNENKQYKLVLNFNDPKFDFEKFKNRIVRKFGRIQQHLPELGRSNMAQIPDINDILEVSTLPEIREIYGLNFLSGLNGLKSAYDLLRSYLAYKIWPPYYESNCNSKLKNCMSAGSDTTKLELFFRYKKNQDGNLSILVDKVKRKSNVLSNYVDNKLPKLECN